MISSISASIAGIQAAKKLQDVSANNVANSSSDKFKKDIATPVEDEDGGVTVHLSTSTEPGPMYQTPEGDVVEGSNVNLADEMTSQLVISKYNAVNIAALKTSNEMQKSLLDIIA